MATSAALRITIKNAMAGPAMMSQDGRTAESHSLKDMMAVRDRLAAEDAAAATTLKINGHPTCNLGIKTCSLYPLD